MAKRPKRNPRIAQAEIREQAAIDLAAKEDSSSASNESGDVATQTATDAQSATTPAVAPIEALPDTDLLLLAKTLDPPVVFDDPTDRHAMLVALKSAGVSEVQLPG